MADRGLFERATEIREPSSPRNMLESGFIQAEQTLLRFPCCFLCLPMCDSPILWAFRGIAM
jgi:hypothetical protein